MLSVTRVLQYKMDGNLKANAQTSIRKKFAFWLQGCTPPPSADAFPYTKNPIYSKYDQEIVKGHKAEWADHDPRPCLIPPSWDDGYKSIFSYQQNERM
mgnify:CR=1 FL=1